MGKPQLPFSTKITAVVLDYLSLKSCGLVCGDGGLPLSALACSPGKQSQQAWDEDGGRCEPVLSNCASPVVATYIRHLEIHRDLKYSSLDDFADVREEAALRSTGSLLSLSIAGIYFDVSSGRDGPNAKYAAVMLQI